MKKTKKQILEKRYCSYCGAEMIELNMPTGFNSYTGKRQYIKHLSCPKYKEHWFFLNKHDSYYIENVFTYTRIKTINLNSSL